MVWLAALAFGVGLFRGLNTSLDMLFGGAVVLLPTLWVAMNLTSGRSIFGPVWLGLARYTLAGVGFGTVCCEAKQPAFGCVGWQWRSVGVAISAAVLATT